MESSRCIQAHKKRIKMKLNLSNEPSVTLNFSILPKLHFNVLYYEIKRDGEFQIILGILNAYQRLFILRRYRTITSRDFGEIVGV